MHRARDNGAKLHVNAGTWSLKY